jgi:hypothetical protein
MPAVRPAVALSLLVLPLIPAHAGAAPARQPPRHQPAAAAAAEVLSADDLNAMVLAILGGRPQPEPGGSDARRRETRAAWARLRGLVGGAPAA